MPKMSERDKHQELEVRLKAMTEQVETSRKRLRERYARIVSEIPVEGLNEREFRDVLGQALRAGGAAAIAALKALPGAP